MEDPPLFGYERGVDGWKAGEGGRGGGAGSGPENAPRAYACIEAAGWSAKDLPGLRKNLAPGLLSSETVAESCRQAFEQSGMQPGQVGYLDAFGSGYTPLDTAEITGLVRAYRNDVRGPELRAGQRPAALQATFSPLMGWLPWPGRPSACTGACSRPPAHGAGRKRASCGQTRPFTSMGKRAPGSCRAVNRGASLR